jgi:hypothetical protein
MALSSPIQLEAKKVIRKGTTRLDNPTLALSYDIWMESCMQSGVGNSSLPPRHRHATSSSKSSSSCLHSSSKLRSRTRLAARQKLTIPRTGIGVTLTETWNTTSLINTKLELDDIIASGVKAEFAGIASTKQGLGLKGQKLSLYFKQGAFNARGFFDYDPASGNIKTTIDGVFGHEGFVVGGEAGYDVQKAALTKYSAALGYSTPLYSGALTATNNLSVFAASYYHKVNPFVEAGVKAAYDVKSSSTVGLEIASKYKIDPTSFAKVGPPIITISAMIIQAHYALKLKEEHILTSTTGQDQRPRYPPARLQRQGQPRPYLRHRWLLRYSEA